MIGQSVCYHSGELRLVCSSWHQYQPVIPFFLDNAPEHSCSFGLRPHRAHFNVLVPAFSISISCKSLFEIVRASLGCLGWGQRVVSPRSRASLRTIPAYVLSRRSCQNCPTWSLQQSVCQLHASTVRRPRQNVIKRSVQSRCTPDLLSSTLSG